MSEALRELFGTGLTVGAVVATALGACSLQQQLKAVRSRGVQGGAQGWR